MSGNKKLLVLIFACIFIALAVTSNVSAIGITPGRVTLNFEPNMQKTVEFTIVNNEHKDMKVLLAVVGELSDYISLDTTSVEFKANEESKTIRYNVNLPASLTAGQHEMKIAVAEAPSKGKGAFMNEDVFVVGATVVVTSQLLVKVPYPYKYAEIRLDVIEQGGKKFYVEVENLGEHDLVDMQAIIEILGPTNEKLAIIKTDTKTVEAGKREELVASWNDKVNPGQYKAIASLAYDEGKVATAEKIFTSGELEIDVVDISVKNFRLGDIAKFDITVENKWSAVVKDVYAQLQFFDTQNQQVANVKSASLDVPSLGRQVLTAYWDTAGIKEGAYTGKLLLNYANKVLERQLKTDISLTNIKIEIVGVGITARATAPETGKQNLMFIIIVVLVIINIGWFIYFKKREKKK